LKQTREVVRQLRDLAALTPISVQDEWALAAAKIIEGERDVSELAAAIERGPVNLREIDSGRLYGMLGNPGAAARHLDRAFRADASCVTFVDESPAFAPFRNHQAIQGVMSKYRVP